MISLIRSTGLDRPELSVVAVWLLVATSGCWAQREIYISSDTDTGDEETDTQPDSDTGSETDTETAFETDTPVDTESESESDTADWDCSSILAESSYCYSIMSYLFSPHFVGLVGLESGETCKIVSTSFADVSSTNGIAIIDDSACFCNYENAYRISLSDGFVEEVDFGTIYGEHCSSLAVWAGSLLALPAGTNSYYLDKMLVYDSFDDIAPMDYEYIELNPGATRMTVHFNTLYSAWHSTDEVRVHDLLTGGQHPSIPLEDYDTWIWGMSVTDDGLLVITDSNADLFIFDMETGLLLWTLTPSTTDMRGLYCITTTY